MDASWCLMVGRCGIVRLSPPLLKTPPSSTATHIILTCQEGIILNRCWIDNWNDALYFEAQERGGFELRPLGYNGLGSKSWYKWEEKDGIRPKLQSAFRFYCYPFHNPNGIGTLSGPYCCWGYLGQFPWNRWPCDARDLDAISEISVRVSILFLWKTTVGVISLR